MRQNPFTQTYGNAGQGYINMGWADEAIKNFSFDQPSEYVYKIVGARGSGKTVVLSDIIEHFKSVSQQIEGWLVYDLSAVRNPLHTLVAYLSKEDFARVEKSSKSINAGANLGIINAQLSATNNTSDNFYDDEVELDVLIDKAIENKKKILVCVDDIAKTPETVSLCSVYSKYIRAKKPVYFVCTGLYDNLTSLGRVKNLTFFRHAKEIQVTALSDVSITTKYKKLLGVDNETARTLEKATKGYAYAYQLLGSLYFNKREEDTIDDLMDDYEEQLFTQCYQQIWAELTEAEKELVKIIMETGIRSEIETRMDNKNNYSQYRMTLKKAGIISNKAHGVVAITLPRFEEYVKYYC